MVNRALVIQGRSIPPRSRTTIELPLPQLYTHTPLTMPVHVVRGARDGRSIIYRADVDAIRALVGFLVNDCCGGHPEMCELSEAIEASCGCAPKRKRSK